MSEKSSEEKAEEYARLLRQGAGNYANLCGVLAGFVAVIIVLALTPGFLPIETNPFFEFILILLSISSIGFIIAALAFINISSTPLWHYKSVGEMFKEYAFNQAMVLLLIIIFLGGVAALTFSMGSFYLTITVVIGLILATSYLIRDWWALAKRPPPQKK